MDRADLQLAVGESPSFRAVQTRKRMGGIRHEDGGILFLIALVLFLILWPTVGTFYAAIIIIAVMALVISALFSLYRHSLYWFAYTFGKGAYRSKPWVA